MSATDLPNLLEIETSAHTKNYRIDRLKLWRELQARRRKYLDDARKHGASYEAASQAADRHVRGEINVFLDELLTHSRVSKVAEFAMAAPRGWGVRSELLLDADPLIPNMIAASYPITAWAGHVDALERAVAEDQKSWTAWLGRRLEAVGQFGQEMAEHVFGAAETIAEGLGEGLGDLGQGLGEGVGGLGQGLGGGFDKFAASLGTAAIIAAGVLTVGVVVVGGIWLLRR